MIDDLVIYELSVAVVGKNHNPSILNPDFLKFNDIVPREWEVGVPPVTTEMVSQVVFKNGMSILSQPNKIIFSEPFAPDGSGPTEAPKVARRYLENVPHVAYEAVGVNPKGRIVFGTVEEAKEWMRNKFLAKGPWLDAGEGLRNAGVRLSFGFGDRELRLVIDPGTFTTSDEEVPVVVFAGNFHHPLTGDSTKERLESAIGEVASWETDVSDYRDVINNRIVKEIAECKPNM